MGRTGRTERRRKDRGREGGGMEVVGSLSESQKEISARAGRNGMAEREVQVREWQGEYHGGRTRAKPTSSIQAEFAPARRGSTRVVDSSAQKHCICISLQHRTDSPLSVDVAGDHALHPLPGTPAAADTDCGRGSAPITVIADAPSVPSTSKETTVGGAPGNASAIRSTRAPRAVLLLICLHPAARPVCGVPIRPSTSKRKITRNRYAPRPPTTTFSGFAIVHRDRGLRAWNRKDENTSASRFTRQLRWGVGTRGCERYLRDTRVRASSEASAAQRFVKRSGIEESIIIANVRCVPPESEGDDPRRGRQATRRVVLRVYAPFHRDQSTEWTKKTKWNENTPYLLVVVRSSKWKSSPTANPWWKRVHSRRTRKRVTIKDIIAEGVDWRVGSLEQDVDRTERSNESRMKGSK
ncbi:hypothetical protein DFH08DRAFT_945808 [Mycena albidolilacea]|uniref:Uncharacterized protein n=1 Tax=Mycena albidolilacea TaxID=1033008 RepID=A0AAD6YZN5_9AGAR|nr:hypothetical protein DFH08DRAFT_945808 [Mycena albidolilacea]